MLKMVYNYVMFEKEADADSLREYVQILNNRFHIRTITVTVNEKYWKLMCEGSEKAWKGFTNAKTTRFMLEKLGDDDTFTYTMMSL